MRLEKLLIWVVCVVVLLGTMLLEVQGMRTSPPPPRPNQISAADYEGKVIKGNRNALFLVKNGIRRMFPDFNTFKTMGFDVANVLRVHDDVLKEIPIGDVLELIPVFRPEDYQYHMACDDPDRLVNDMGTVANMGDLVRFANMYSRVKSSKSLDLLLLGGSITAGGYFMEFVRSMREQANINVTYHNHGHGATEITYSIFCVDLDRYKPDLVFIDFSVNDYGHPKLMDTLIRKTLSLPSKPVVVLVNLWVNQHCPVTRYLLHGYYYQLPILNVCPAVNLCYGKYHLPKEISDQYSLTDGVHPWGKLGVKFLGDLLFAWWKRTVKLLTEDSSMDTSGKTIVFTHSFDKWLDTSNSLDSTANTDAGMRFAQLPPPLYDTNPIGLCTRCEALTDDADGMLTPVETPKGFRIVTRVKVGYGGFNSDSSGATRSVKKSWLADKPGSQITFKFFGSSIQIAIWQRRDGMGVLEAFVDGDQSNIAKATGFFKGYTWAMERNNTGRSEIVPLFEGLKDGYHTLTLRVSEQPANPWVKGHLTQIFALLSASDQLDCRSKRRVLYP